MSSYDYDDGDPIMEAGSSCIDCGAYEPARLGRPTICKPCASVRYADPDPSIEHLIPRRFLEVL